MSVSAPHEALIELFRQRPPLAFEVAPGLRHLADPVVELAGRHYPDLVIAALGRLAQPVLGELVQQGYVYQSDFATADQEVRRRSPRFRIYTVLTIAFVHPPDRRVTAVA